MKKIYLLVVLTIAATLAAAQQPTTSSSSQSPPAAKPTPTPTQAPPPPSPAARPTLSEERVYMEASGNKHPQKKIGGLEKFPNKYPDGFITTPAHLDIPDALIKSQPEAKEKILAQADKALQRAPAASSSGST